MLRTLTPGIACVLFASSAMAAVTMQDVDVTNDNFATFEEVKNAIPGMDLVDFRHIDTNGDNRLSADEMATTDAQNRLSQHSLVGVKERPLVLLDQDGDGFISLEDIQRIHPDFTMNAFKASDSNGDNRLSYQEYYATETQQLIAQCGPKAFMDLASIDANGDKFADFAEVQAAYPSMGRSEFREIDLNSDNRVSAVEWLSPRAQCIVDEHGG